MLETNRLRLRLLARGDFDSLYAMFNDPLVMRYYPGVKNRSETRAWIARVLRSYDENGFGLWAVELKETGEFLGQCGLTLQPLYPAPEVEVGYMLRSERWHQGYATEAAAASRDYALHDLGLTSVISLIRPENQPSRRVAERLGMKLEKEIVYFNRPHLVYRTHGMGEKTS